MKPLAQLSPSPLMTYAHHCWTWALAVVGRTSGDTAWAPLPLPEHPALQRKNAVVNLFGPDLIAESAPAPGEREELWGRSGLPVFDGQGTSEVLLIPGSLQPPGSHITLPRPTNLRALAGL